MKIQLLSLVSAAVALSLPEMPALPDLVEIVQNPYGNFSEQTVEEPKEFLPIIAEIRAMTDQERGDRFHWFLFVFLLVFVFFVISGTVIMVMGAELKAFGSYRALDRAPLSQGAQLRLVMLSFGGTVSLSLAACLWSLQTGRLSKTLGLDWEVYLLLFCCVGAWLLFQAVLAVVWLKAGDRFDATAFAVASFSSMAPLVSDQWDTLKDIIFGGLCFQSQHWFMKIVGVLSWLYLLAFHGWFFFLARKRSVTESFFKNFVSNRVPGANCLNELAMSHLSVLLIPPKVQGEWSGGCWEGIILPTIYKQVTKSKRHHLLIENVPQALMSLLFLAVEGGSFFVAALNLVIPAVQIVLTFLLFKPVRTAAIPALGKRLSRAMKSGNTVAAKVLWEEAEIEKDMQLFALMLPHLTFFLDETKRCGFMREELKDLDQLSDLELRRLQFMAALFAGQASIGFVDEQMNLRIDNQGAKVLGEALKRSATAQLLLLGVDIDDQGAEALADGLKNNSSLTACGIVLSNISDRGAEALAESFKQNSSLECLVLLGASIGDRGAEALAESLKNNGNLAFLALDDNNIGDPGAEVLAESLKSNGSLVLLSLSNNNIGDRGAKALAAALLENRSLGILGLSKFGSLWHCLGSRGCLGTPGHQALEEAEKIKQERGDPFTVLWDPESTDKIGALAGLAIILYNARKGWGTSWLMTKLDLDL